MAAVSQERSAKPLDAYVEDAIASRSDVSDWSDTALKLTLASSTRLGIPPKTVETRDPFTRLFTSNVGQRVYSLINNEGRSLSRVGTIAVQPLLEPEQLDDIIAKVVGKRPDPDCRRLVVNYGEYGARRSVLVLDPGLPMDSSPVVVPSWLFAPLLESPSDASMQRATALQPELAGDPALLQEAAWVARPRVVVGPAPPMEKTCVPVPPWRVECGAEKSTAGILAKDANGKLGVTTCFHATGDIGTKVQIHDDAEFIEGVVSLASQPLDTCFVPVGDNWHPKSMVGVAGVLEGRAPGKSEKHRFRGFQFAAPKVTEIIATDWGVPFPIKGRQLCIQTKADTNHGDSGAALINEDDRVVGFAFQRTPFRGSATVEFADWIWAQSALAELGLSPL